MGVMRRAMRGDRQRPWTKTLPSFTDAPSCGSSADTSSLQWLCIMIVIKYCYDHHQMIAFAFDCICLRLHLLLIAYACTKWLYMIKSIIKPLILDCICLWLHMPLSCICLWFHLSLFAAGIDCIRHWLHLPRPYCIFLWLHLILIASAFDCIGVWLLWP